MDLVQFFVDLFIFVYHFPVCVYMISVYFYVNFIHGIYGIYGIYGENGAALAWARGCRGR